MLKATLHTEPERDSDWSRNKWDGGIKTRVRYYETLPLSGLGGSDTHGQLFTCNELSGRTSDGIFFKGDPDQLDFTQNTLFKMYISSRVQLL